MDYDRVFLREGGNEISSVPPLRVEIVERFRSNRGQERPWHGVHLIEEEHSGKVQDGRRCCYEAPSTAYRTYHALGQDDRAVTRP